jgi:hypothetical protein
VRGDEAIALARHDPGPDAFDQHRVAFAARRTFASA